MKQYILLRGGVETLGFFSEQIVRFLRENEIPTFLFTLTDDRSEIPALMRFLSRPGAENVLLTFNFHGLDRAAVFYDEKGILIWDRYQVECRNILVDHPFYYFKDLQTLPERYIQICIDGGHERYMRRFYPEITLGRTTPLAGTAWTSCQMSPEEGEGRGLERKSVTGQEKDREQRKERIPIAKRRRNLIFTGNYTPPEHFNQYITRLGAEYEAFYREIITELLTHTERSMEEVFEEYMCREMGNLSNEELREGMSNLIFLDLYVRFFIRGKVVRTLVDAGIPVEVYGKGWERLECNHPENLIQGGLLNSKDCLEKTAEARLSLNVMPWFKQGSHDRIYNAMKNGAVCISDSSEYLSPLFTDGRELFFYSLSETSVSDGITGLPERVRIWQKEPERLQQMADWAAEWVEEHASWEQFVEQVMEGEIR